MLNTPLAALLGVRYPIIQAPMAGGWTTPALVAAVSNAGGLGMVPAARTTVDQLDAAIAAVRALTQRPFGVNFLLAPPDPFPGDVAALQAALNPLRRELGLPERQSIDVPGPSVLADQLALVMERGVPIVSFAMGDPAPLVPRLRAAGVTTLAMVTSVAEAVRVERAGVDAVIAQGAEAGGHRATFEPESGWPMVGTLVLVPQVVDAVRLPVVAAGGIMDGRGVAAVLALGAQAAQLGTRFLLTHESGVYPSYRERLVRGEGEETTVTTRFTGRPARALRNRILDVLEGAGVALPWPHQAAAAGDLFAAAAERDRAEFGILLAGQGLRPGAAIRGAAEVVAVLVAEAGARIGAEPGTTG